MTQLEQRLRAIFSQDLSQKKTWYSAVAQAYHLARPRYPQSLIDQAITWANLTPGDSLLELGCGPGIATPAFAQKGLKITALEPSEAACAIAQQQCNPYPHVQILNSTFEEWPLPPQPFPAVLAASSFHWLSPHLRHQKAAQALSPEGSLILLWNIPPQPQAPVQQIIRQVHEIYLPELAEPIDPALHEQHVHQFGQQVIDSGYFDHLQTTQLLCEKNYTVEDYLALLHSLSQYIQLDPPTRDTLFHHLHLALTEQWGQPIPTTYLSLLHVAKKGVHR
ncbi:class I SAM-dependent methyltransferase [Spirulina subsalsa FACHB-351]|uniref:Class I SAM-dependent methyltransferase n=1 Tax=Spirulina subsalsa FACHB-351 TaxID=234711 RepID=A0ABT3L685_9CYAN|nr:class I SAM-dependent methyltransferase [Spirulina subsalsa]MCW6037023.1 class I SAM-dependent methyltransferase [Spirulina subsalsa FACHB-351]